MSTIQIHAPQVTPESIRQRVIDQDRSFALYYPRLDGINDDKFYIKARAALLNKKQTAGHLFVQTFADRRYTYMCCRDLILSKKYPERNKSSVKPPTPRPISSHTPNGSQRPRGSPKSPPTFKQDPFDRSMELPRSRLSPRTDKSDGNSTQSSSEQLFVSSPRSKQNNLPQTNEGRKGESLSSSQSSVELPKIPRRRIDEDKKLDDISTTEYYQFVGLHCYYDLKQAVTRVRFGHCSRNLLAFACADRTISVIDVLEKSNPQILKGHTKEILDFDWSSTNDYILSASKDKTLRLWDVKSLKCIRFINNVSPLCCCFHPVNNNLLVASTSHGNTHNIEFFNSNSGKEEPKSSIRLESSARTIVFSPDGMWLYAGCNDGIVRWFRCTNPNQFNAFKFQGSAVVAKGKAIHSLSYREFHSISKTRIPSLLINAEDSPVKLLMIEDDMRALTPWTMCPIVNKKYQVRSCFSPLLSNGTHACFATGSEDCNPYMYLYPIVPPPSGLADVKRVPELTAHGKPVLDVAWNVDESLFASVDLGGTVFVWKRVKDLEKGKKEEGKKELKEEKDQNNLETFQVNTI